MARYEGQKAHGTLDPFARNNRKYKKCKKYIS